MSEPKRYEPSTQCVEPSYQAQMIEPIVREVAWGNYVRWEDYARLKAEVERLTERNKFLEQIDSYLQDGINIANEERCIQLEAQVERLTKAGDAIISQWNKYGLVEAQLRLDWHAAKGVQS